MVCAAWRESGMMWLHLSILTCICCYMRNVILDKSLGQTIEIPQRLSQSCFCTPPHPYLQMPQGALQSHLPNPQRHHASTSRPDSDRISLALLFECAFQRHVPTIRRRPLLYAGIPSSGRGSRSPRFVPVLECCPPLLTKIVSLRLDHQFWVLPLASQL